MNLADIVALAKAGYTPKQVKELLEMVETSPKVQEAKKEDVINKGQPEVKTPEVEPKVETEDDPIKTLINILKEE